MFICSFNSSYNNSKSSIVAVIVKCFSMCLGGGGRGYRSTGNSLNRKIKSEIREPCPLSFSLILLLKFEFWQDFPIHSKREDWMYLSILIFLSNFKVQSSSLNLCTNYQLINSLYNLEIIIWGLFLLYDTFRSKIWFTWLFS